MKKILVSECLHGGRIVRYDGKEKVETNPIFVGWKEEGRLITVCPEVFGGLPTPRVDSQRLGDKVVSRDGRDVTGEYTTGALEALRLAKEHDIAFAIMKEKSPSCGVKLIYDGTFSGNKVPGMGITTQLLREAGFKVFSEEELEEAKAYLESLE
ncbi:MAG: DUF523 domain-containing protein [Eubacterium sp.]|nr:DUF523 domain-containing protein [Candidatus Colimonas fimequi]